MHNGDYFRSFFVFYQLHIKLLIYLFIKGCSNCIIRQNKPIYATSLSMETFFYRVTLMICKIMFVILIKISLNFPNQTSYSL